VDENESLDSAAARELQEETSVDPSKVLLTQVCMQPPPSAGAAVAGQCSMLRASAETLLVVIVIMAGRAVVCSCSC
jgi:ADP-ribose pyrophosphatase YjhB (NUDIX family)